MGRASSAKKVARAARAGGKGAKVGRDRSLLFPGSIALVVILGLALVVYARTTINPAEAAAPGVADHWHEAYGIYACGEFLPDLQNSADPNGIHTHSDGVIHVHPGAAQQIARTGKDATMEVFLTAAGASISDDRIDLPGGEGYDPVSYIEGETTCDGEEDPIVQVAYWFSAANTDDDPDIITDDLADIQFGSDGAAYTIAFAPDGADIPPPDTAGKLPQLGAIDGGATPTPSSIAPGAGGPATTVAPGGPTTAPPPTTAVTPTTQP